MPSKISSFSVSTRICIRKDVSAGVEMLGVVTSVGSSVVVVCVVDAIVFSAKNN
jgi:hypothetical protein